MRPILPLLLASCMTTTAQVVQWGIEKRQLPRQGLTRRATSNTTTEIITNELQRGGYFATVSIGTPPQNLTLQIDTGSSDVWVPLNSAKVCVDTAIAGGCTLGSFTPDDSSTFEVVGEGLFDITFVDNSQAKGDYFEDRFTIGDVNLNNFTMGLAITSSIPYGLVGLGYASNEAILDFVDQTYPNLPEALVDSGAINTIAYSLWLNDLDASTGSVLFGGIDTEKYVGNLTRINVLKEKSDPDPYHFEVALTSLIATSPSGSDTLTSTSFPISAVLDSGTTLTYLPQDLAEQVWAEVGAVYDANEGGALIPCSFANNPGHFSFGFAGVDGPRINVTMDELVLSSSEERGPPPTFESGAFKGQASCAFGIQNYTDTPILLGDTFLRSAYVVYDLVNNEIGIAPTDFNSTKTNVIPFPSNGAEIPRSTPAPNQDNLSQGSSNSNSSTQSAAEGFKGSDNDQKDSDSGASRLSPGFVLTGALALHLLGLL